LAFGNVVLGSAISAMVGIIGLILYTSFYSALNTAALAAADVAVLSLIPTLLTFVIVISIVVGGFAFALGGNL
jgi:hypothetical protein